MFKSKQEKLIFTYFTVLSCVGYALLFITSYSINNEVLEQFQRLIYSFVISIAVYFLYDIIFRKGNLMKRGMLFVGAFIIWAILIVTGLFFFVGSISQFYNVSANYILLGITVSFFAGLFWYSWFQFQKSISK
ncbi:conserved hypothetical protein (plasmid) [Bacillus cereus H3081.97]|uniref:hypothetical protein n=1 Tax=Bacillus toyonensis TaxID=155322 RepID=UPI00016B7035|nr:hypothetical protein [Bacillus toyonensis]ACI30524.1 conserved hypothetical protein [Bacillus cereus H3081.97]QWI08434.1 hypothetical protein EXW54_27665 [Bacillus toyonensis]